MENNHSYRSSSMGYKAVSHKPTSEEYSSDHEESGWTAYFQDFSNNNNNNIDIKDHENILEESFCTISSSLVSDAASYAASKIDHDQTPKKLSFKKTRAKEISQDDSLEDTASSPVNSPKVRYDDVISIYTYMYDYYFVPFFKFSLISFHEHNFDLVGVIL